MLNGFTHAGMGFNHGDFWPGGAFTFALQQSEQVWTRILQHIAIMTPAIFANNIHITIITLINNAMTMIEQTAYCRHTTDTFTGKVHNPLTNHFTLAAYNTLWPAQHIFTETLGIGLHKRHHMRIDLTGNGVIDVIQTRHFFLREITTHTAIDPTGSAHIRRMFPILPFTGQTHRWKQHRYRTGGQSRTPDQQIWRGITVHDACFL